MDERERLLSQRSIRVARVIDCKTVIFFANASDGQYSNERSGASLKTARERMGRDAKKYDCPTCIY